MGAFRCSSAEEMVGCALTTQRRVTKSGDLTAIRKTPPGFRDPEFFRAALSLLRRSSTTAACSLRWDRVLGTSTHPHWFMRSVPTVRERPPRAGFSGLLARSVAWWEPPLRKTVYCTSGTLAERFIVW